MPYYVAHCIQEALNNRGKSLNGARILILGAAYKKDVEDPRESPSLKLIQLLNDKGTNVSYNDPYIPSIQLAQDNLASAQLTGENLSAADCVVIATDHSCYNMDEVIAHSKLVFDARGATRELKGDNIIRLGE